VHVDVLRVRESTLKRAFRESIANQENENELFNSLRMDFASFQRFSQNCGLYPNYLKEKDLKVMYNEMK
jgi:hypothetical protein